MSNLPRVTVIFSNGNLLRDIAVLDGICGLIGTVASVELIGAPKQIFNLVDAVDKGFTEDAEPFMYRQIKEFYDEVGGNQELWVMGVADTAAMSQVLDNDNADGAVKLVRAAQGVIRILGVCRQPDVGYSAGDGFFDSDVEASFAKAQIFGAARLADLIPLRILIEGRVVNEDSVDIFQPKTAACDYGGLVVGGSANDGSASVGTALGRASKYPAHIKIGKVANGPLAISKVYIGTKELKDVMNLDTLHGYGIISFTQYPGKAGIFFGIDRMANDADYRLLAYGRVIDKAAIITASVYIQELESEVNVNADGTLNELDVEHLKGTLKQQVNAAMADQYSSFDVTIDPKQNIINTSKLKVKARVIPKGYTSFIDVDLGLNAPGS